MMQSERERKLIDGVILRGVVGSTAWGLNVEDGIEDRDEMAVTIEPFEIAFGFETFDSLVYRTAAIREGKADAKSMAGDLDLVIYSLRKYVRMALKGNPSALALLFQPDTMAKTNAGDMLQRLAPDIVSKRAGRACLGYMTAQKQRLIGERGQMRSNRPELVERHGFNTKYAMHMLRLGYQGIELMKTGRLAMPIPEPARGKLLHLRQGGFSKEWALAVADELESDLKAALESISLRDKPDEEMIERWMVERYREAYGANEERKESPSKCPRCGATEGHARWCYDNPHQMEEP